MLPSCRTYFTSELAVLVSGFVALYPYLDFPGYCGHSGCSESVPPRGRTVLNVSVLNVFLLYQTFFA